MKNKICILNSAFTLGGGAEKISFDLGKSLKNKGFIVYYYSFINSKKIYPKRNKFYYTLNENKNSLLKYLSMLSYAKSFASFCKKNNITKVISHSERPNIVALFAKKYFFKKLKVFSVVHNIKYFNRLYFKFLLKNLYPLANKIICVSKEIEMRIKIIFKLNNVITIYNFFDFNKIDNKLKKKIGTRINQSYFAIFTWHNLL